MAVLEYPAQEPISCMESTAPPSSTPAVTGSPDLGGWDRAGRSKEGFGGT